MMYAKLALENVKKSTKDYLIYIVTLTACISMFYAFLSISSNYYDPNIGAEFHDVGVKTINKFNPIPYSTLKNSYFVVYRRGLGNI